MARNFMSFLKKKFTLRTEFDDFWNKRIIKINEARCEILKRQVKKWIVNYDTNYQPCVCIKLGGIVE